MSLAALAVGGATMMATPLVKAIGDILVPLETKRMDSIVQSRKLDAFVLTEMGQGGLTELEAKTFNSWVTNREDINTSFIEALFGWGN